MLSETLASTFEATCILRLLVLCEGVLCGMLGMVLHALSS